MREVQLKAAERKALEKLLAKRSAHAGHVRRARIILLSADGMSGREIAERVGISTQHVSRIRARFVKVASKDSRSSRNQGVKTMRFQLKSWIRSYRRRCRHHRQAERVGRRGC